MSVECVEDLSVSVVTVREHGKRASFNNPQNADFQRIRVDDCLIKEGMRADWIVRKVGVASAVVELKGADVGHACRQLHRTAGHPAVQQYLESRVAFLVVSSRSPSFDTRVARAKEEARKAGIKLTVKTRECVCAIENLC